MPKRMCLCLQQMSTRKGDGCGLWEVLCLQPASAFSLSHASYFLPVSSSSASGWLNIHPLTQYSYSISPVSCQEIWINLWHYLSLENDPRQVSPRILHFLYIRYKSHFRRQLWKLIWPLCSIYVASGTHLAYSAYGAHAFSCIPLRGEYQLLKSDRVSMGELENV